MNDLHSLPVYFKKHAVLMLAERFELDSQDAEHLVKTAKLLKPIEKDGEIGLLQSCIGECEIRFVFTIRKKVVWIITVEEI